MSAGLVLAGTAPGTAATVAPDTSVQVLAAKPAPNKVTISKIKTTKVNKKTKRATVKPSVKATGKVKVTSSKITVKQGKKTVAKNVSSAKLKVGKYSVATTAKYKTWTNKTTTKNVKKKVLVSGPKKPAKMSCVVDGYEHNGVGLIPVIVLYISCTGAFPGVYETHAIDSLSPLGDWKPTKQNGGIRWHYDIPNGPALKWEVGTKFTTNVYAVKNIYKTTTVKQKTITKVWSKEQTKTLKQTLTVKK
ncbi:hypothetical protein BLJ79_17980 [Arthrobacter sp. UCD-GKA]|uniref:hypothetical protein n=1 Tax=Arthrobacter sp. UCD-GKA TaxID=1913576 RepID=UPI0008DCE66A|nr:hypothetical protein [Arthrobacter sp. UCD-GKA]OIH82837.1 hypothetical protein BLJ79_17980 [Arthrobacter sp. UCD-GKA]